VDESGCAVQPAVAVGRAGRSLRSLSRPPLNTRSLGGGARGPNMKIVLMAAGTLLGVVALLAATNFVQLLRYRWFLKRSGWNVRHSGLHALSYVRS
jgi:hypothetical protein